MWYRTIYSTEKRKEYATIIDNNVRATECSRLIQEAEVMSCELQRMREAMGTHNNECSDREVSLVRVGNSYMNLVTGEMLSTSISLKTTFFSKPPGRPHVPTPGPRAAMRDGPGAWKPIFPP
jgi:hypothetical protein